MLLGEGMSCFLIFEDNQSAVQLLQMSCFLIFEDNQGAVQLLQNPVSNSNSKHNNVRHHFFERACSPGGHFSELRSF